MSGRALRRIVLVTSNGRGLGHLSREIAIALAIGDRAEVIIFSFSQGLPVVTQFGIRAEFCPGQSSPWIPPERWHKYVEKRFELFLAETRPEVVLFDGVAPYNGVINALRRQPSISAGWLRRGMWKSGPSDNQLLKAAAFDFVIEPGDIAGEADKGPTADLASVRVPPVSLLEVVPALGRGEASAALGLDPDKPALLIGLSSGLPGDPRHARSAAIERALQHTDWQVGLVNSPLADHAKDDPASAVQINGVYPMVRYLTAFDAAISAAGYNSVHELIPARLPTLFIPTAARTDDQTARAASLARRRLALWAAGDDIHEIGLRVDDLLGDARDELVERLDELSDDTLVGGAAAVADIITTDTPVGIRETGTDDWREPGFEGLIKRAISPRGVELVRRVLGRSQSYPPQHPVSFDGVGASQLLMSDELESVHLAGIQPVEHMLAGASASYRGGRRDLIDEFYAMARQVDSDRPG
jgi:hypothetical protein